MTRIVHLSDLHYGRDRPELEQPLLDCIHGLNPDLVAISGDFTQRARVSQFERARSFLDRLHHPWMAVPGNHDTPLDNLWVRLLRPWSRYRAAIDPNLEPTHVGDDVVVVGVNTVNRFSWQRGRLSDGRIRRACTGFGDAGDRARIVMVHHPLQHAPDEKKRLARGAAAALEAFADCGAQIVLSGHLHNTVVRPFRAQPGLLFVQAGTSLSSRLRGEPNTFNVLDLGPGRVVVRIWGTSATRFEEVDSLTYIQSDGVWQPVRD